MAADLDKEVEGVDSEAKAQQIVTEINYLLAFFAIIFVSYLVHVYFLVTAKQKELAEL
jgi:hypothetical protein